MFDSIMLDTAQNSTIDEDEELVSIAQQNPAEFRLLYQKWLKRVYRYFYFRVGNKIDAEDLTSQVFLKIYEDLPHYRNRGCFSAWLFTIAHARMVDYFRKGRRDISLEEIEQLDASGDVPTQASRAAEIREMLGMIRGLSAEEQELIRLRFVADLSYREIGIIKHRSEDAVRKSISRLLSRIQLKMEANHG